jgi:hypothetical protein
MTFIAIVLLVSLSPSLPRGSLRARARVDPIIAHAQNDYESVLQTIAALSQRLRKRRPTNE